MNKRNDKSLKLNEFGFSLVEGIVALGIAAIVGVGGMKLSEQSSKQASFTKQNMELDQYIRRLRTHLTDKASCNQIIKPGSESLSASLQSFNSKVSPPLEIKQTKVIPPSLTGAGREVVPASVIVYFKREAPGLKSAYAVKKTTAMVEYNDGKFVGCSNFESESEMTTFKLACESLGGTFSLETGVAGSEKCDFSSLGQNHYVLAQVKKRACEKIYNGVFDGAECDSMNMPLTPSYGANLKNDSFFLADKWVKTFEQSCPGDNNFVGSISPSGEVTCKSVSFCTKCDASCPATGTVCDGELAAIREPAELKCDEKDGYALEGSNSSTATNKCNFEDYSPDSDEQSCVAKKVEKASAGICKRFKANTCDGAFAGVVENYPDGTACGTDKVCASGSCVNKDDDDADNSKGTAPKCENGLNAFASKSKCESETGKTCKGENFLIWSFPDRVNDPVNTKELPMCNNWLGTSCATAGTKKACTSERRLKGEEEILPCKSTVRYCPSSSSSKKGVWKRAYGIGEDSCDESVPKCSALIGKPCDIPGLKECNDNPVPKNAAGNYCQINDVVQCVEK
ncbi:MAG: hypothetical protein CME67_00675 [Halobacteriovoraceae bacterium]|nr:hypothetical protein [Halobacteriovoraceae bacterium]|tara:strand:- start:4325 stop:6031 length:1707 start_codon:yes stop_codon:yes gene_type:complete